MYKVNSVRIFILRVGLGLVAGRVGNGHRDTDHVGGDLGSGIVSLDPVHGPHYTFRTVPSGAVNRRRISADHPLDRRNQGDSRGFEIARSRWSPVDASKITRGDGSGSCHEAISSRSWSPPGSKWCKFYTNDYRTT